MSGSELLKSHKLTMDGKVVVITGATSGIGNGIATALASAGAHLIMLGYHKDTATATAKNITAMTGNKNIQVIAPFDLSSFKSVNAVAAQVLKVAPKIDVLVCDAGLNSESARTQNVTDDGFEITFQVTFLGHFLLTETLLPALRAAKGRVVNTGSISNGFHNLSYAMTIYQDETLCQWQGTDEGCESIDYIKKAMRTKAKTLPFGLGTGNTFFSLYFKTFYAQEFSAREATNGVSMYTGHPGLVESTQNAGLNNKTIVKEQCEPMGWAGCNCVADSSLEFDISMCPLDRYHGSAGLAWLAAAPKEEIEDGTDTRFFSLCIPLDYPANQYKNYALTRGESGAQQYAKDLTSLWQSWVKPATN